MDQWLESTDKPECRKEHCMMMADEVNVSDLEDGGDLVIPALEKFCDLILNNPGYDWLVSRLQRETRLSMPQQNVMDEIKRHILDAMPATKNLSRKSPPQGCNVKFYVRWDPITFLEEQDYDDDDSKEIGKAVTITGTYTHAQALGCSDYLAQTWPLTGPHTLQLIEDFLMDPNNDSFEARESTPRSN